MKRQLVMADELIGRKVQLTLKNDWRFEGGVGSGRFTGTLESIEVAEPPIPPEPEGDVVVRVPGGSAGHRYTKTSDGWALLMGDGRPMTHTRSWSGLLEFWSVARWHRGAKMYEVRTKEEEWEIEL